MKSKRLLLMLLMALLVPWAASAQETLTVHNGTSTNRYVPFYGYYSDDPQTNQMIYPATELADMAGGEITAMMFYWTEGPYYQNGTNVGNWTISIGETSATTLSGLDNTTTLTQVFSGYLPDLIDATNHILPITFANAYSYGGSNLLVQFSHAASGYKDYAFYGETVTGASYSYNNQRNFLPKTTFTYEAAASDCPKPDNFVASNVTAHTADLSWESDGFEFVLQYKKASDSNWTQKWPDANSYTLTGLAAETEYQVRVAAFHETCPTDPETGDHVHSDWREISFTTSIACPAPTNLAVTPESIAAREATVTWEGTSNSYVVMIGQENLAARANFETGDLSQADFTSTTSYPFTVVENTHSGSYCAVNSNCDAAGLDMYNGTTSDMVLEVTLTRDMTLTFSAKVSSESSWDKAYFSIDGTVQSNLNAISGNGNWIDYSYPLAAGTHTLRWYYTKDGSGYSNDDCFYVDDIAITAGVASWTEYNTSAQTYTFENLTPNRSYLVKVKGNCGDEGYSQETAPVSFTTLPSCFAPTGLAMVAGYPTAHGASFTWDYQTGEVFQFALVQGNVTDPAEVNFNTTWNAGDNFPMWNTLSADTDWSFFLRKNCDGDFSDPVYVYFHTLEACPAPTGFAVMPNSITAHTANLTWQGTSNSYQVAYRTTAYMDGTEEGFSANPTGWLFRTGALNADGTATLSGTTSWSRSTNNGVFDTHIYMNMYSTKDYWLITPSMEIQDGYVLSLDMAYTAYSGTQVDPTPNCPTHRFAVLISTDDMQHWTILREWNNSGSEYVLDAIPTSGQNSGNIDLSAYVGQTAYIAFFGHSETSSYDNNFHFDNVAIGTPVPAGEWQYITNVTEVPCQLTGLLAERKYEATLQGDCENEGVSTVVGPITFTTSIACPAPTALNHANVKSRQVDLSWTTGGAEDWVLAYKKTNDANFTEVNLGTDDVTIEGTTVTYTLTGLDEETEYTVKVRDNCEVSFAGDGQSAWTSELSFTTMAACSVDNVTVSNISHYAATINWDGESNKGFTVKYRTAAGIDGIEEGFSANPTGWLFRTGALNADGTATLSGNSSWSRGTYNDVFDTHIYMNMYSTKNYWLITPSMEIQDGYALSLDMAYTAYSGTQVDPTLNSPAHRFAVLISTDDMQHWTILREWNNSGSEYVLDAIPTSGQNSGNIDLSAYAGQTAYIAFFGHSETYNYDNNFHFDNVTIGTPVEAGSWQENETNESPYIISGLEPGTKYDLKVAPICDETLVSEIQQFTTASASDKWFITEGGNWGIDANWEPTGVPTIEQTISLHANAIIESGCIAEAKSIAGTTGSNAKTLTIKDGAQLRYATGGDVVATVEKEIAGYGNGVNADGNPCGYYLLSNPLYNTAITPSEANGFLVGQYDLYKWDYTKTDNEWRNFKDATSNFTNLQSGFTNGFLYANQAGTTLTFTGYTHSLSAGQSDYHIATTTPENYNWPDWYLYGNTFTYNGYLVDDYDPNTGHGLPYYIMNEAGDGFTAVAAGTPIAPMQGFFYQYTSTTDYIPIYFLPTEPISDEPGAIEMAVNHGHGVLDNAIIVFGGKQSLGKMSFRKNSTKVYMPVNGKDYAIVSTESNVGEMPVNFKAEKNGNYTLSFTSKEVSFSYLHLIDNMTGADVNLLETPSYSFNAQTTDYESRFRLVFATGSSVDGDSFAFINGAGNLSIFGIEGEATVQVMDALGRMVSSNTFSGSYECKLNVAPGVYMIRLIQGNDVKVQKMVIR